MAPASLICPNCGRTIPASAAKELCPACLLSSAFGLLEHPEEGTEMPAPAVPSQRWGAYELLEQLGRGGMGIVFRARDVRLNRIVALKLLLTGKLASDIEVKRFRTEAEAAARLAHPNIVAIYEVGEEKGLPFFTMKLVEGGSLATQLLEGRWRLEKAVNRRTAITTATVHRAELSTSETRIASLFATIARAVHFAHQHGILHRDLKPANILLDESGEPFVSDFGLARRLETGSGLTVSGDLLGTPTYMAPEVTAHGSRQATVASDIYSLGAVLYEVLTGRPPFEAATVAALLRKIAEEEPIPPSRMRPRTQRLKLRDTGARALVPVAEIDRDLETICLKCLSKDPAARYNSAEALAEELERWLRGEPILARPATVWEQALKWSRRKPAWALVLLLTLLTPLTMISLLLVSNARVRHAQADTRLNLYAADIQVAQNALQDANLGLARQILEAYTPQKGETDLRGFEWRYLWHLARSGQLRVLRAHSQPVDCLAFAPDGNWLGSCEAGRAVWFWSTTTWKAERVIDWSGPQHDQFRWLSFAPDGKTIAVLQDPGYVSLFDERSLKSQWFLKVRSTVDCLQPRVLWSPTGRLAFLASDPEGTHFTAVLDWPALLTNPGRAIPAPKGIVQKNGESPDQIDSFPDAPILRLPEMDAVHSFTGEGRLLAGRQGQLYELELMADAKVSPFPSAHQFDYCERSPDGRFLAGFNSLAKDRHSVLMDEFESGITNYWEMIGHDGDIRCLAISPDSGRILTGSADHTARVWDVKTRKTVADLRGHIEEVTAVAWSHDGKLIATGSKDRTLMLWTGETTNQLQEQIQSHPYGFAPWLLSDDGAALATKSRSGTNDISDSVIVWNLLGHASTQLAVNAAETPLFLGSSGRELLTLEISSHSQVVLRSWNVEARTNSVLRTLALPPRKPGAEPAAHWVISADRNWLARGDSQDALCVWRLGDANGGISQIPTTNQYVIQMALSPDSRLLAVLHAGLQDTSVLQLWNLTEMRQEELISFHTLINSLAWSSDSRGLAAAANDHTVQRWDVRQRRWLRPLAGHKRGVMAVAFSPDGRTVASGDGRSIKLWQAVTGREMATLFQDIKVGDPLQWLSFTPDGTRLLAADEGGRIQIFVGPPL